VFLLKTNYIESPEIALQFGMAIQKNYKVFPPQSS